LSRSCAWSAVKESLADEHLGKRLLDPELLLHDSLRLARLVELPPRKVAALDRQPAEERVLLGGHRFPFKGIIREIPAASRELRQRPRRFTAKPASGG
jgi:hypothetical protein